MKRKLIIVTLAIFILTFSMILACIIVSAESHIEKSKNEETTISEAYIPSETTQEMIIYPPKPVKNYVYEIPVVTEEEENLTEIEEVIEFTIENNEYPTAAYVWIYLQEHGYNDYVIAGILGNMMVECGGHTLALQETIYNSTGDYYGLCQWSLYYYPEVENASIDEQLDHLINTIEKEFNMFGYISGYSYSSFLEIQNEQTAAFAFAKTYERCGSGSYESRQSCASEAFSYFSL